MAHSSLLGIDRAQRRGTPDAELLGPSDSSDTGSDVANIGELDAADPTMPVDTAMGDDRQRSITPIESLESGADSDMQGTGERRSAAGDDPRGDAPDISTDRVEGGLDNLGMGESLDEQFADAMADDEDDEDDEDDREPEDRTGNAGEGPG